MINNRFQTWKNPVLYELNTAAWLYELSQKLGRPISLGEVPPAIWDDLKKAGINFLWLMGIWQRSQYSRQVSLHDSGFQFLFDQVAPGWQEEDVIGSAYSISSYNPDPAIGSWSDIDSVRRELHQRDIGLILDFIPNHTGTDFPWAREHPDYYVQGSVEDYRKDPNAFIPVTSNGIVRYLAHGKDPYFPPWTDTLQINHFNPQARSALINELTRIAQHCDGLRCDVAMLVLNDIFERTWDWALKNTPCRKPALEFWTQATRKFPELVWIAESYWNTEQTLISLGFDYAYDKTLYDLLRGSKTEDLYGYLQKDTAYQEKLLRFIENHDELRSRTVFGRQKARAAAVLFSTLPGMKMFYQGQFEGARNKLPVQIRRGYYESPDSDLKSFYEKLLAIIGQDVFHSGIWQTKYVRPAGDASSHNLLAYLWRSEKQMKIIAVNFHQERSQGRIALKDDFKSDSDYTLIDELNGREYIRQGKEMASQGLHVILEGYQAHIFDVR